MEQEELIMKKLLEREAQWNKEQGAKKSLNEKLKEMGLTIGGMASLIRSVKNV